MNIKRYIDRAVKKSIKRIFQDTTMEEHRLIQSAINVADKLEEKDFFTDLRGFVIKKVLLRTKKSLGNDPEKALRGVNQALAHILQEPVSDENKKYILSRNTLANVLFKLKQILVPQVKFIRDK